MLFVNVDAVNPRKENPSLKLDIAKKDLRVGKMPSLIYILFVVDLFFQESHACAKHEAPKIFCDVHSYYYGNCTYDRFGIREQLRLPKGYK